MQNTCPLTSDMTRENFGTGDGRMGNFPILKLGVCCILISGQNGQFNRFSLSLCRLTWERFQHRPSPNPFRGLALRASIKQLGILRNLLEFEPWLGQTWHTQEVTTGKQQSVWSLRVAPLEIQNHLQALDEFPINGAKFGASLAIFQAKFEVSRNLSQLGFQVKFYHHLKNMKTQQKTVTTSFSFCQFWKNSPKKHPIGSPHLQFRHYFC